ncbi:MAG: DUF1926 domain-containing protein [Candidatus Omnitrophota bacterium]|nr:MAG: DUF1926 domain-containing protein [Candidatus Omnitrophota bacterium]
MGKVYFLFGVHNHQPVGNFDYVFRQAYEKCYLPFISTLQEFPKVKCSIHTSGPLYDWMKDNGKEYITILNNLVNNKQVELISGGYYEPILPLISDKDREGQVKLMNDFIEEEFKFKPQGFWLAERVWEPYLAAIINRCGLKYTFLDDTHFRYADCGKKEFFGYYTTEDQALPISVFPISKALRYKIPFSHVREAIGLLNSFRKEEDVLVTLFDDGEKFGMWPRTFEWVHRRGWLKKFFSFLEEAKNIQTITPYQAQEKFNSCGIIYLPTASYEEMGEWVLEPESFSAYEDLNNFLKSTRKFHKFKDFVRGGFFRNFYKKYSRLNYMHKRMLTVSKKINEQANFSQDKDIFINLWKAQTNCGYWHGIFGGFYLSHIRGSVYEKLITAQNLFDKKFSREDIVVECQDFNFDGVEEIVLKNRKVICCFSSKGATLLELSLRDPAFNLINTITRKQESYHKRVTNKAIRKGVIRSIHDILTAKEDNLKQFLIYDRYERLCLVDHLLNKDLTIDDFAAQKRVKTFSNDLYEASLKKGEKEVILDYCYRSQYLDFSKIIKFSHKCGLDVSYKFSSKNEKKGLNNHDFGIEFNLAFVSPQDVFKNEEKAKTPLDKPTVTKNADCLEIVDNYKNITLRFNFDRADVYTLPLYSVSSSESGFEKVYQQIVVLFIVKEKKENFNLAFNIEGK